MVNILSTIAEVKPSSYLSDNVENVKDAFGVHTKIADALSEKIIEADVSKHGLSIGLFGEWGSGKSVIIEKLHENLASNEKIAFVNIDVWKYNGIPLLRHILYEVAKQGPNKNFKKNEREKLIATTEHKLKVGENVEVYQNAIYKKIIKLLPKVKLISTILALGALIWQGLLGFTGLPSILAQLSIPVALISWAVSLVESGIVESFKSWFSDISEDVLVVNKTIVPTISPEQFESMFDEILAQLFKKDISKYVIVFDNIDRCKGDFAYDVLSSIKTYMDKKNCIYIIPCDEVAIKHYLSQEYAGSDSSIYAERDFASEFLDKLFTTYFRIPLTNELARDKFIDNCLSVTTLKDIPHRSKIVQILYYAYKGETPRQIKKYINDLISYYEIALKADPDKRFLLDDIEVFAVMVAIKQIAPNFEKRLVQDPHLIWTVVHSATKDSDPDDWRVKGFLDKTQFKFPKNKSLSSYIYFEESSVESELSEKMRDGQVFELTADNITLATKILNNDQPYEQFLFNDFSSVIKSILAFDAKNFLNEVNSSKSFEQLYFMIGNIVEKSTEYAIVYNLLKNIDIENVSEFEDVFALLGSKMIDKGKLSIFFDKMKLLKNPDVAFAACLESKHIMFNQIISKWLTDTVKPTSGSVAGDKILSDGLLCLLNQIINLGYFEYITPDFISKILPLITYENSTWRKWELCAMETGCINIYEHKIFTLSNDIETSLAPQGVRTSTNIGNLVEKLEYLSSFSVLPGSILGVHNDALSADQSIEPLFSNQLIKLQNFKENSADLFVLGSKLFGTPFIEKNFETYVNASAEKETFIKDMCHNADFLEIVMTSSKALDFIKKDETILKVVLDNTTEDWKVNYVDTFIHEKNGLNVIKLFYTSTEWGEAARASVLLTLVAQTILRIDRQITDTKANEQALLDKIDYTLKTLFDANGKCNALNGGDATLLNLINQKFDTAVKLYPIFEKYHYNTTQYLLNLLEHLNRERTIAQLDIPSTIQLDIAIEKKRKDLPMDTLQSLAKKCVNIANKQAIISIGLSALNCLGKNPADVLEEYGEQFDLIKAKGICVDQINQLLDIPEDISK